MIEATVAASDRRGWGVLRDTLQRWHDRYETHVPLVLGVLVGVGAGVGAALFRWLINSFHTLFFVGFAGFGAARGFGALAIVLLPALGGLLVGPLTYFFAREAKGHGVPEVMLAVHSNGGRIRARVAIVKSLASSICIGSGGSVGREGPIVQIGSALGSTLGQALRLPPETTKLLVACGAAGGIAATFNAPVAGVFFALEVILGRFSMRNFSVVVLSSVVAATIGTALLGSSPAFVIPAYAVVNIALELPLYAVLGVLAAVVAVAFMTVLDRAEDAFEAVCFPEYLKPVLGGIAVGLIGLWQSDVFGVGYEGITGALLEQKTLEVMALLIVLKIAATSLTLGSGGSGGVFAPSLFMGAMLGGAFGAVVHIVAPADTASYGAYAIVGMGAVFAGTARAPITAVIILFEMTRDYSIILPLMTAVVISATVAELLQGESIYTMKLLRRGIDLRRAREAGQLAAIRVAAAMQPALAMAAEDATVESLGDLFRAARGAGLPVVNAAHELVGIVTQSDLDRLAGRSPDVVLVREIATAPVATVHPGDTLDESVRRMRVDELRQLAVVDRRQPTHIVGMLSRADIVWAYAHAHGVRQRSTA